MFYAEREAVEAHAREVAERARRGGDGGAVAFAELYGDDAGGLERLWRELAEAGVIHADDADPSDFAVVQEGDDAFPVLRGDGEELRGERFDVDMIARAGHGGDDPRPLEFQISELADVLVGHANLLLARRRGTPGQQAPEPRSDEAAPAPPTLQRED